jgi:hypothetical protein
MRKNIKKAVLLFLLLNLVNCSSSGGGSSNSPSSGNGGGSGNGNVAAIKIDNNIIYKNKNELMEYSVNNNVVSANKPALQIEDNNTKVFNDKTLEANYTRLNLDNDTFVVEVDDRGYFTNTGIIQGNSYGVSLEDGGVMINSNIIKNNGDYGVFLDDDTALYNYGEISNTGKYGVFAEDRAKVVNEGRIQNSGPYGILVMENGTAATNNSTGKIMNTGDYGIYAVNRAAAVNNGTVSNYGNKGMAAHNNASVVNNGTISNTGTHGMYISSNSTGINNGTIELTGNNLTGVYVSDRSTFTNNGIIKINGTSGVGIEAVNNSTVKIAQNSKIILDGNAAITQSNTNYALPNNNVNTGGTAYKLDSTSQLVNAGVISTTGVLSVNTTGKFILDSNTGSIEAKALDLKKDIYINMSKTMNSSLDTYDYKDLKVKEITGTGEIKSASPVFTAKTVKTPDGSYSVLLERKNFDTLFNGKFGEVLEKNYAGSENISENKQLYNSIKNINSVKTLSLAEEEITGRTVISNSLYNQFYQNKVLNNGIDSILSRRDTDNVNIEYYFEILGGILDQKNLNASSGFDSNSYGVTAGAMIPVNNSVSLGGFLSYLNTDIDYKDNADSSQDVDTFSITGIMENKFAGNFKLITKLGYNYGNNDTKRKITYDNTYSEVNGDYDTWSLSGTTGLEYSKEITKNITLKPSINLILNYASQEEYTETGSTANVHVDSVDAFSAKAGVGIKADMNLFNNGVSSFKIIPKINYYYEMADPYKNKNIRLASFTDTVDIWSREAEKNDLNLGVDLEYSFNNFSIFGGYNAGVLDDANEQYLSAGFKFFF